MTNNNWEEEPYVKERLSKVGKRTQKNYRERFPRWLNFIGMNATEQNRQRNDFSVFTS